MVQPGTNVCVFCGSSNGTDPVFIQTALELGERLAEAGFGLVYGGGGSGLMEAVSTGALSKGGAVTGVIPRDMVEREWARHDLTTLHTVCTMHQRKEMMYRFSSALVTLPGGIGTYEEFFESLTWQQLGYHSKLCLVLNVEGYFDHLEAMLEHALTCGFIRPDDRDLVKIVDNLDDLMTELSILK